MGKREKKKRKGTNLKPRLAIHRSNKHIYAQVVDDSCSKTIISCSTLEIEVKNMRQKKWRMFTLYATINQTTIILQM